MGHQSFIDMDGKRQRCLFPGGHDPLLAAWRAGDYDPHPTWTEGAFWVEVERLAVQQERRQEAALARKEARNGVANTV